MSKTGALPSPRAWQTAGNSGVEGFNINVPEAVLESAILLPHTNVSRRSA